MRRHFSAIVALVAALCVAGAARGESLISFISGPDPEGITPVYWLGHDGELHHIQSPATAARCFGPSWVRLIRWCGEANRTIRGGQCRVDFSRLRGNPIRDTSPCPSTRLVNLNPHQTFEPGMNRPGSDYRSFDLQTADPRLCQQQCAREQRCVSWTYVNPGVQGPHARCWLKHAVPQARREACCTSGVK